MSNEDIDERLSDIEKQTRELDRRVFMLEAEVAVLRYRLDADRDKEKK